MPVLARGFGTAKRDDELGTVRVRRPELRSGDTPAALDLDAARAHCREVGARVWLAHADTHAKAASDDLGNDATAHGFTAVAQDLRPALAVGDPVHAERRARCQQLFANHVAFERAASMAAVFLGESHADVAALAAALRERGVVYGPGIGARLTAAHPALLVEKRARFAAQRLRRARQAGGLELEPQLTSSGWSPV